MNQSPIFSKLSLPVFKHSKLGIRSQGRKSKQSTDNFKRSELVSIQK